MHTNHLVVADRAGNVVSYTNTIEQIAGSGITVPGRGFLLNNELTDFNFPTGTANSVAPNKRPRSSMSPMIVLRNGRAVEAVGSPGGSTIITTVLQTLINQIDFGMSLPEAIEAPRASQRNSASTDAEPAFIDQFGAALQARGQSLSPCCPGRPASVPTSASSRRCGSCRTTGCRPRRSPGAAEAGARWSSGRATRGDAAQCSAK